MSLLKSKDIIIIFIGIITSIILAFIFPKLGILFVEGNTYLILGSALVMLSLLFLFFIWILHRRINELEIELEKQQIEQKRLNEKLKIHEQLIDMKAEIKELQKRCKIKNGWG